MRKLAAVLLSVSVCFILLSCSSGKSTDNRTVVWASSPEFAQYIELFNITHPDNNVVLVYKDNPADCLPPARDEAAPDIIAGPYLRNDKTWRTFKSLEYLFDRQILSSEDFYTQLIQAGKQHRRQYLLPVSFNLPCVMFASENSSLVTNNYSLTVDQIREIAAGFNQQNKNGAYTKMGFTPLAYPEFPYLVARLFNVNFRTEKGSVVYDNLALKDTIKFLKDWSGSANQSVQTEDDFAYKYLFMPDYRQATSGRCLFSYTTSDELFRFMDDEDEEIDYRWIYKGDSIPVEDSLVMMGIYKDAGNVVGATEFISWFLKSENQKAVLERKSKANLDTEKFGIAGGFSAVREVNDRILPLYYKKLLSNLPPSQMISVPQKLPAKWESYKEIVIEPYIQDAVHSEVLPEMVSYIKEWEKQVLNN
ncbi:MAG: hypothetical protein MJ181_01250 [Treponema sp.]|nr:hypothetical protein [Treponema sp.]